MLRAHAIRASGNSAAKKRWKASRARTDACLLKGCALIDTV
jgi:hypothetical protein